MVKYATFGVTYFCDSNVSFNVTIQTYFDFLVDYDKLITKDDFISFTWVTFGRLYTLH